MSTSQTSRGLMKPSSQPNPTQLPLILYRSEPPSSRFSHSCRISAQGASDSAAPVMVLPDGQGFYSHVTLSHSESQLNAERRAARRAGRVMDPNFLMPPAHVFGRQEPDLYALGHKVNSTHHSKSREGSVGKKEVVKSRSQSENCNSMNAKSQSQSQYSESRFSATKSTTTASISSSTKSTTPSFKSSSKKLSYHSSLSKKHQPRDLRYLYDWSNLPSGPPPPIYADYINVVPVDKILYHTEPPNSRMSRSFRREEPRKQDLYLKDGREDEKENNRQWGSVHMLPRDPSVGKIARKIERNVDTTIAAVTHKKKEGSEPQRIPMKEVPKSPNNLLATTNPSTSSSRTVVDADTDLTVPLPVLAPVAPNPSPKADPESIEGRARQRILRRSQSAPLRSLRNSSFSTDTDIDSESFHVDGPPTLRRTLALAVRKPPPRPLDLRAEFKIEETVLDQGRGQAPASVQVQGQAQTEVGDTSTFITTSKQIVATPVPAPTVIALGPLSVHFADGPPEIISFYTSSSDDGSGASDTDTEDDADDAGSMQDVDAIVALGLPWRTKDGDTPHPAKERFSFGSTPAGVFGGGVSGGGEEGEMRRERGSVGGGYDASSYRGSVVRSAPAPAPPSPCRPLSALSTTVSSREGVQQYSVVKAGPNGEVPEGNARLNLLVRRWLEREGKHSHFIFARSCEMKYDVAARLIYYEATFEDVLFASPGETRTERFYPVKGEVEWRRYH